jgi:sugar phosphate isomerase/epimerase
MGRPVTLFTGQWADLPLEDVARKASEFGYEGLELACWGDHFEVDKALADPSYCTARRDLLERYDLQVHAISAHLVGQAVLDKVDARHQAILPAHVWGDGEERGVNARAAEELKNAARAAQRLGVGIVNGFTGSSIWHLFYSFPPVPDEMIEAGYALLAERFHPILDVFAECGVQFALEVHPTEIAFDLVSAQRTLAALARREEFGFNFDPSHLHWQGVDPVEFLRAFPDRIYHVHVKDAVVHLNGKSGILASHLPFGDPRRGWEFRSPGRGSVDFEEIIRALNQIKYAGPLSVEWEDPGMDREAGAREAYHFVKNLDFTPAQAAFDAAFTDA